MKRILLSSFVVAMLLWSTALVSANTLIDFETPLPGSLTPMSYSSGGLVPSNSSISDQYSNLGIMFENVALISLGLGHAASGVNGIAGFDESGRINYNSPLIFKFINGDTNAVTDYFSIVTDLRGGTDNNITIEGFDLNGNSLGATSYPDGAGGVTLELQNIGMFHSVVVSPTMQYAYGGIACDNVSFGNVVPEPTSLLLFASGLIGMFGLKKKS